MCLIDITCSPLRGRRPQTGRVALPRALRTLGKPLQKGSSSIYAQSHRAVLTRRRQRFAVCRGAGDMAPETSEVALVRPSAPTPAPSMTEPSSAREDVKPSGDSCKIYLGNLSFAMDVHQAQEAITKMCKPYGEVLSVEVPWQDKKKKKRQRHNGFGFVTFGNEADAAAALEGLAGAKIEDRVLKVRTSTVKPTPSGPVQPTPSKGRQHIKLFVGSLPLEITANDLRKLFEEHGTVVDTKLIVDDRGNSRGYGFVTMASQAGADEAMYTRHGSYMDGTFYEGSRREIQRRKIIVNSATRWKVFDNGEQSLDDLFAKLSDGNADNANAEDARSTPRIHRCTRM